MDPCIKSHWQTNIVCFDVQPDTMATCIFLLLLKNQKTNIPVSLQNTWVTLNFGEGTNQLFCTLPFFERSMFIVFSLYFSLYFSLSSATRQLPYVVGSNDDLNFLLLQDVRWRLTVRRNDMDDEEPEDVIYKKTFTSMTIPSKGGKEDYAFTLGYCNIIIAKDGSDWKIPQWCLW